MAYKEPYTVVTKIPSTGGYSLGDKLCYHYTLTLGQVKEQIKDPNMNKIYQRMIQKNYKRVTISQVILLQSIRGTKEWKAIGSLRVPDESYFLKN